VKELDINGETVLLDDADYEIVIKHNWHIKYTKFNKYVVGRPFGGYGSKTYLHHFLIGKPKAGFVVDHVDENGLNNQRKNLQFLTYQQNVFKSRRKEPIKTISGIKGVYQRKDNPNKWQAYIQLNRKNISLGSYDSMEEARNVRNEYIKQHNIDLNLS
jgi:hypothetical protein